MQVGIVGLNHKCADLGLREKILKACRKNLNSALTSSILDSFVLLITCNRVEVYFASSELTKAHAFLLKILRKELAISFEHKLYSFFRWDCFRHLCEVTSGLDSAVLAETEIQGQVKSAYVESMSFGTLSKDLHFLFQKSLQTGKKVRTRCLALEKGSSFERTVLALIEEHDSFTDKMPILFVGASDINQSLVSFFKKEGLDHLFLCNRTKERGMRLAKKWAINWVSWETFYLWNYFPIVILATKSPDILIGSDSAKLAVGQKKLILDLSVPRNVAPGLARDSRVTLYNMDQVNKVVGKTRVLSKDALFKAQAEIQESMGRFVSSYRKNRLVRVG